MGVGVIVGDDCYLWEWVLVGVNCYSPLLLPLLLLRTISKVAELKYLRPFSQKLGLHGRYQFIR
jgi:hypothetical protein